MDSLQLYQTFARTRFRHIERLYLGRHLAGLIVDTLAHESAFGVYTHDFYWAMSAFAHSLVLLR